MSHSQSLKTLKRHSTRLPGPSITHNIKSTYMYIIMYTTPLGAGALFALKNKIPPHTSSSTPPKTLNSTTQYLSKISALSYIFIVINNICLTSIKKSICSKYAIARRSRRMGGQRRTKNTGRRRRNNAELIDEHISY